MVQTFSLSDVEGELLATMEQVDARPSEDTPFRVLIIGDWSGRANRGLKGSSEELAAWRPRLVDRDNLDQVIARLGVKLHIALTSDGSQSLTINFNKLDDFHPDRLSNQLEIFEALRRTRAKLSNPKTFAEAAKEVRRWRESDEAEPPELTPAPAPASEQRPAVDKVSGGSLLDDILAGGSAASSPKLSQPSEEISPEISELAKAAAKPYLTPDIEADQDELIALVDARIAGDMNAILHHPDFQALESAWRALDFLATRLDTGTELKLYVLDISFEEFKADLRSSKDFRATAMYKLLVEQTVGTSGGIPWAVIAANYTFDFASGDPGLIENISLIAKESGAPFVAGTTAHLLGCESLSDTPDPDDWRLPLSSQIEDWWADVTRTHSAAYVGLALPRFLLRLPYGKKTEPTEEFEFEEMASGAEPTHKHYLWANPAFAVAYLLAKGFSEAGWNLRPSDSLEIDGLPLHIYEQDGSSEIKPCAEVLLTLRAAKQIIDRGLMPLLSLKDSDTIRLGMFQSIAGTQLAGPWG
jgi:type VI secretion system protein ImpC